MEILKDSDVNDEELSVYDKWQEDLKKCTHKKAYSRNWQGEWHCECGRHRVSVPNVL